MVPAYKPSLTYCRKLSTETGARSLNSSTVMSPSEVEMTAVGLPGAAVGGAVCGAAAVWRVTRTGSNTSSVIRIDPISHTHVSRSSQPHRHPIRSSLVQFKWMDRLWQL